MNVADRKNGPHANTGVGGQSNEMHNSITIAMRRIFDIMDSLLEPRRGAPPHSTNAGETNKFFGRIASMTL
jgi:hypothetical protein